MPEHFLQQQPFAVFEEWMDSFWAKDVQELFPVERYSSFRRFVELVMVDSGGIFEATRFAESCEVSRPTIAKYLAILEATHVAATIRPFTTRRAGEIVSAPRVYGFDTGFVVHYRGWREIRREDLGVLWEHFVLNELIARAPGWRIHHWRTKHGREVDFVLARPGGQDPVAVECKWSARGLQAPGVAAFRRIYPTGLNFVVASDVQRPYLAEADGAEVEVIGVDTLVERLNIAEDG